MFVLSAKWHTMWHKMEILKSKYLKTERNQVERGRKRAGGVTAWRV